jgi:threonine/homoserine/homoserine lactone efflux protein
MASTQPRRPTDPDEVPSLFAALVRNLGPGRSRAARQMNLEVILGILGFFSIMALISLVAAELRGGGALFESLVTIGFLGLTWMTYRSWRRGGGWSSELPH